MRYATIAFALRKHGVTNDEILMCELIGYRSQLPSFKGVCRMNPEELAAVLGLSRKWGYYTLNKLCGMGWVEKKKNGLVVTDKYTSARAMELFAEYETSPQELKFMQTQESESCKNYTKKDKQECKNYTDSSSTPIKEFNITKKNINNPPISPQGGTGSPDGSPLSLEGNLKELNPEESAKVSPKHSTLNNQNPTPPVPPPPPPLLEQYMDIIRGVFSRPRLKPTKFLTARIKEGMTLDDCRLLCEYLTARWGNDPKMKQYLDTTTPFRKEKHPGYMALAQEWLDSRASREKARETAERLATEWKSIPGIQIDTRAVAERLEAIPDYDPAHLVSEARAYIRFCNTAHRIVKNPENWLASMSFSPTRPVGYDHEAYMAMGHEQKATERKRLTDAGYRPVQSQDGTFCGFFKKQDIESLFPGGSWFNAPAETYRKP